MSTVWTPAGLAARAVAGTYNVLLTWTVADGELPEDFLGFSIERRDALGRRRWLPNFVRFANDPKAGGEETASSARAPVQRFRWGDYAAKPATTYTYRIVPRRGTAADLLAAADGFEADPASLAGGIEVVVTTADVDDRATAIFFNRGAAASQAYVKRFGDVDPEKNPAAKVWLSRGLEEALVDFVGRAKDRNWAIDAAIYEFQKPEMIATLAAAKSRGVAVRAVYHGRRASAKDHALAKNLAAISAAGVAFTEPRAAPPQGAIMHHKFVVLKQRIGKVMTPVAVWTGSTNWTEAAIWGQLNVGHAVWDADIAACYARLFEDLVDDRSGQDWEKSVAALTPVPAGVAALKDGITPIFSPQPSLAMLDLYAEICRSARVLFVSAPFLLHEKIRAVLASPPEGALHFVMLDKPSSFAKDGEIELINRRIDPQLMAAVATRLDKALHDFQNHTLMKAESFHHNGVHIHSKIILADPFGPDPILVTGSANFSEGSTIENDENSLIFRGDRAVSAIYATEFARMFEHYWFRWNQKVWVKQHGAGTMPVLAESHAWASEYMTPGTQKYGDRSAFAGPGQTRAERAARLAALGAAGT